MTDSDRLIRRVNQLFHELTQDRFDEAHCYRHRIEGAFWERAARMAVAHARRWPAVEEGRQEARSVNGRHGGRNENGRHGGWPLQSGCDGQGGGLNNGRPLLVAEVGCGTGFVTTILGRLLSSGDRLVGMDLSEAALAATAAKWRALTPRADAELQILVTDAQQLPLVSGSADIVALNAALHHLPRPERALVEIDRVLRPGGVFALGFEPNRAYFHSPVMPRVSRVLDRACWYASPRQNRRRLEKWLGATAPPPAVHSADADDGWDRAINARLLEDRLVRSPLSRAQLLDLVDPHARGAGDSAGFDPVDLIERYFHEYTPLSLQFTDYLGESPRRMPLVRGVADRLLGLVAPGKGALFSWLLRKPAGARCGEPPSAMEAAR